MAGRCKVCGEIIALAPGKDGFCDFCKRPRGSIWPSLASTLALMGSVLALVWYVWR